MKEKVLIALAALWALNGSVNVKVEGANVAISALTAATTVSTNTLVEVADLAATPKSRAVLVQDMLKAGFSDSATAYLLILSGRVQIYPTNLANAQISASAAIDATKIADGSVSSTVYQRLAGVTSGIQGQLDGKVGTARTVTLNGTALDISVSGGAQDFSADRVWSFSLDRTATLAGNPALAAGAVGFATTGLIFEGATANNFEGLLTTADPTGDRSWTLPDADTFFPIISQVLTISGMTAARTMTVPDTNFTAARTDAGNAFTGHQTVEGVTSTGATGTGNFVFSISPTFTGHITLEGVTPTGATGTGKLVFDGSPALATPTLGVASATTINKVTMTTPATGATLTLIDGKTLTVNNTLSLFGTDSAVITFQGTDTYVGRATTDTLTNKRLTARVTTISSSATPTVNTDDCDCVTITALAAAITSMTTNLSGTPVNFAQIEFRIKDDGTARAITWGASFASGPGTLPTTTVQSKALHVYFEWDSVQSKWMCQSTGSDS